MKVAEKSSNEAVLDHSNGMFIVVLRLYQLFFAHCRHPDGFTDVVAFDNTHCVVVAALVLYLLTMCNQHGA